MALLKFPIGRFAYLKNKKSICQAFEIVTEVNNL